MDLDLDLSEISLENKYAQYILEMREKYKSFGGWADNHAMLLNSFLQTRFSMTSIIDEINRGNRESKEKIAELERRLDEVTMTSMIHELAKEKAANDYATLVKSLMSLSTNYEVLEGIISNHASILSPHEYFNEVRESGIHSSYQVITSKIESEKPSEEWNSLIV